MTASASSTSSSSPRRAADSSISKGFQYKQPAKSPWAVDKVFCYWMLGLSDTELLLKSSTSPECEGPLFLPRVRRLLRYILEDMHGLSDE
jgi:hypothetical protein